MKELVPENDIERALAQVMAGQLPLTSFLPQFLQAELAVPSGTPIRNDFEGFRPILFKLEQVEMLACFTGKTRFDDFARQTPHCLLIKGGNMLRRMPPGYGVVVNPGWSVGYEISPAAVKNILAEFVHLIP